MIHHQIGGTLGLGLLFKGFRSHVGKLITRPGEKRIAIALLNLEEEDKDTKDTPPPLPYRKGDPLPPLPPRNRRSTKTA